MQAKKTTTSAAGGPSPPDSHVVYASVKKEEKFNIPPKPMRAVSVTFAKTDQECQTGDKTE